MTKEKKKGKLISTGKGGGMHVQCNKNQQNYTTKYIIKIKQTRYILARTEGE